MNIFVLDVTKHPPQSYIFVSVYVKFPKDLEIISLGVLAQQL